jgi:hypothetical protein
METMGWTLHAQDIRIDNRDGFIDLKQFHVGLVIELVANTEQAWMIIDVRAEWLKVRPLFDRYKGDPRKHKRFHRYTVDRAFEQGHWRIGENR